MTTKSKAEIAVGARALGFEQQRFSQEVFCFRQDISPGHYRKLKRENKGPREDADGKISLDAEADWMKARADEAERARRAEAAADDNAAA